MRGAACLALIAASLVSAHAIIVIDSFSDTQPTQSVTGNTSQITRVLTSNALGGSRAAYIGQIESVATGAASLNVNQALFVSNDFGSRSIAVLGYYSVDVTSNNAFVYSTGTNVDLTGATEFWFSVLGNDRPVNVEIKLFDVSDVNRQLIYRKAWAAGGAREEVIGQADIFELPMGFDRSQIDFLTIRFDTEASGDLAISRIAAVPEPGTLAALGLGTLALLKRRKKS